MKFTKLLKFHYVKTQKTPLSKITFIIFLILAIICGIAAFFFYTFVEKDHKSEICRGEETYPFSSYLSMHVLNVPLNIYPSDDNMIHIDYICDSDIIIYEENGRIYIEQDPAFVIPLMCMDVLNLHVNVYLPEKEYTSIEIETNSGNINMESVVSSDIFRLKSKSGIVNISDLSCSGTMTLNFEQADSFVTINKVNIANINCNGGVSSIKLNCPANLNVRPDSLVYLNGIAADSYTDESTLAKINLSSLGGKIRITTK